ncbi:MAG: hypothetical protein GEV28_30895 [Actinophytocola sp.]|nr:hypothetical protein [Actinophytocola sp.]
MKPAEPTPGDHGFVDGAWWPRSRDLVAELPTLLAALAVRLGEIQRMAYNLAEWEPARRHLDNGGHRVRLGGFHSQGTNTIDVTGSGGHRVTLLVVPPETAAVNARAMSLAAADGHNVDSATTLLARRASRSRNTVPRPRRAPA